MNKEEIFNKVKSIISEKLAIDDESTIKLESSFVNDLRADSMDILDLVNGFEEEFDISIPDEIARNFEVVEQAVDYLLKTINK